MATADISLPPTARKTRFASTALKASTALVFVAFVALYLVYVRRQYVSLFHEAEFLHIGFLRSLVNHSLSWDTFLARFGEHLFPGYNLLLAVNYYLFGVSGAFDTGIFTLSLIAGAAVVVYKLFLSRPDFGWLDGIGALLVCLILLSPTNNPMFSMAQAASVGTLLFLVVAALADSGVDDRRPIVIVPAFVLIPIAILFFLGGYSIGAIAAFLAMSIVWIARSPGDWRRPAVLAGVTLLSTAVYAAIVLHYRGIVPSSATSLIANAELIVRFALVLTGSGLLGKAFAEATGYVLPYYVCGAVLVVLSVAAAWHFARSGGKNSLFALALIVYPVVNIAVVTISRFNNGVDGAMGQWYSAHTHFLPIGILYYLYVLLAARPRYLAGAAATLAGLVVATAAYAGYWYDWKKAYAAAEWKRIILFQVPAVLAFEDQIVNKNDQFQTLLWDLPTAKASMKFLYENRLWVFRRNPLAFGISPDNWVTADQNATIVCPQGTKEVRFRLSRPPGWPDSSIEARTPAATREVAVRGEVVRIELLPDLAAVLLSAKDKTKSNPVVPPTDQRSLAAMVTEISCGNGPG
jgi:hypothetical protein